MKKFVKSFLLAAAALVLFAGCSNLNDATVSGDSGKAVITIGIDGMSSSGSKNVSRTINPTPITSGASFGSITLKGESENGNTIDEYTITFDENNKAKIELSYDVWYLTLSAYSTGETPKLLMQGRRRVDMRNGAPATDETISFKLSAEGVTTTGGVNFTGTFTDTTGIATKYTAALYDLNTNDVISGTALTDGNCSGDNKGKFAYVKDGIKPGRYGFRIYFYMEQGTGDEARDVAIGTWGDVVVIAPGRTTPGTLALGDILYKTPKPPKDLSAYYVKNSASGNDYQVLITWTDDSTNEEYFELTIQDVTDAENPVDYKIFGDTTDTETPHVKEVFWESASRVDGTLAAGSNYCIVKLPLSKKFEISLKAVNFVGKSTACARTKTNTAAFTSDKFTVPANTAYGAENVNLMSITYDLNGGVLKTSATTTKTGSLKEYHIFKSAAIDLKEIKQAGSNQYPQLLNNGHPFVEWQNSTGTGVTAVSDFGNTTVTASFNPESTITYTIDDSYGTIVVTAKQGSDDVKNKKLKTTSGAIKIEWEDANVKKVLVKVLQVSGYDITQEQDINGNTKSMTFNKTGDIGVGTHQVVVIVTKNDGKQYADTFTITKEI